MNYVFALGLLAGGVASLWGCWLAWQLLRQNGRIMLRLEALDKGLGQPEACNEAGGIVWPPGLLASAVALPPCVGPVFPQPAAAKKYPLLKHMARWSLAVITTPLRWLMTRLALVQTSIKSFELKHLKFVPRADDIFIVTYPRSGTTWMQMILYQLTTDGSMALNHIAQHSPWFERSSDAEEGYEERPGPRVFKSHLRFEDIPKGPGCYIYVARDGRDAAVSYYNFYRSHNGYKGTFAEFFDLFMRGKVVFGSWFEHVGGWWRHRHELNVLFLTYEELVANLEGCMRRIISFCRLNVPEEKLPLIVERCSFAFMKKHQDKFDPALESLLRQETSLNQFVRAGRVGEGSRQLSKEQQARFHRAFQARLEPVASAWPKRGFLPRQDLNWQAVEARPASADCI